jgi:hypothetical protein
MHCKRHILSPSPRGFTVVEVMLAAAIMVAGIVGMMFAVTSGAEMLDTSRKQTIATQIMHGELERIRVSDWTKLVALTPDFPMEGTQQGYAETKGPRLVQWISSDAAFPQNVFRVSRTLKYTGPEKNRLAITYQVNWTGTSGRAYSRTSSTFVGKNGLYVAYQR